MTSLRELYADSSSSWTFTKPSHPSPVPNSTAIAVPRPSFKSRPAQNSIFDLSPDFNDASGVPISSIFRIVGAATVLQYTSTAIAMPWEVGKLLLQVQWVPRNVLDDDVMEEEEDGELSDSSNDNDSYFADPESTPRIPSHLPPDLGRRSIAEDEEHIIRVGSANGVWGMIKRIGRFHGEGWLSLWKGLLTSFVTEMISTIMSPLLEDLLSMAFDTSVPVGNPRISIAIASHIITGFFLSPLDLIRTRLIVQSASPRYRNYSGPLDAFRQILKHEGGLEGMYLHPQLLIPTILDNALRPVVSLVFPHLLVSYFGVHIGEETNPVAWGFTELIGSCIGLLITLPIETVRRRLQVQVRGAAKPINGCVKLRPVPYNGVVDAIWRILTEERSDLPLHHPDRKRRRPSMKGKERAIVVDTPREESWWKGTGLGQLYRGMGMRLGASAIVFLLTLVSRDNVDGGWAEL